MMVFLAPEASIDLLRLTGEGSAPLFLASPPPPSFHKVLFFSSTHMCLEENERLKMYLSA